MKTFIGCICVTGCIALLLILVCLFASLRAIAGDEDPLDACEDLDDYYEW